MKRRDFLRRSLATTAALAVPGGALGCEGPETPLDAATDAPMVDAGPPPPPLGLSKGPFVQLAGIGRARLRFETRVDREVLVRLERGASTVDLAPMRVPMDLTYERAALDMERYAPDRPGLHVLHELMIEDLTPGELCSWTVEPPEGEPVTGRFTAPVAPGAAFRFGWLSDTSFPFADPGIAVLAARSPHLVLHGGDITYQANPFDTWNGMMRGMRPLLEQAPVHFCVGNHEFEAYDEIVVQYDRLFAGQGDLGGAPRYFAFTYGAVRFICIDTESGALETMDDTQLAWLDRELDAVDADATLAFPIVAFHRPTYTLSRHAPGSTVVRDLLHARFVAHGVPLVFAGHVHAFERFLVDGVHYVIDGGGGAVLYDPDEEAAEVEALRPGEGALRQAVSRSQGVTVVEVAEDATLTVRRLAAEDGAVQDELVI